MYEALKHYDEADSLYEEALRLNPTNDLVLNNYGYSLADADFQLDRALTMAKKQWRRNRPTVRISIRWDGFISGWDIRDAAKYVKEAIAKGEANAIGV